MTDTRQWVTSNNDLVAWLRVCLDGDEQAAREAGGAPWEATVPGMVHVSAAARAEIRALRRQGYVATADNNGVRYHIALHDPARALAEVDAKRRILDECRRAFEREADRGRQYPGSTEWALATTTLRLLALPYADQHGYRQEWRP